MIEAIRVGAILLSLVLGLFFTLVSATGVIRLPDVYSRAHTASQSDTLGAGFALAGVALSLGVSSTSIKAVLLLFFIFVTNPTAAHAISRAAHEEGIEPWTVDDDRTDRDLMMTPEGETGAEEAGPEDGQPGTPAAGATGAEERESADSPGDGGEPA